jgi:small nuclear ribonucleoprotein (snRNP)-like protein
VKSVLVSTRDGQTFRGRRRFSWTGDVVLEDAELLEEGSEPERMSGRVVVPRENVALIQVPK